MNLFQLPLLAYLDPTSGSLAFQMAIGGIVSAAAALRLYRAAVARFLRRCFRSGAR